MSITIEGYRFHGGGGGGGGGSAPTTGFLTAINVKTDHGAKGDNATDDTAAIQAAFNAARSLTNVYGITKMVYFPSGTYLATGLVMPHRLAIMGSGHSSTLKLKANSPANAVLLINEQNYSGVNDAQMISIHNLRLNGNRSNQPANAWQDGLVFRNDTPSGSFEYTDGRHQVSDLVIEQFTGTGFVQSGRGGVQAENIQVWACGGFGFNLGIDSLYVNCDAGGSGIDGFLIQGNNLLVGCKAWFSGSALTSSQYLGTPATAKTVTPPPLSWNGGNLSGVTFSFASGFGNGFHYADIGGASVAGNFNGGTASGCCAQDNGRAGFYIRGGRQTLSGCEADSNSNNGTVDGTASGAQLGDYAGFEIDGSYSSSHNTINGLSWDRAGNLNHQAGALRVTSGATMNRIELQFRGSLLTGANMPPLIAGSVISGNLVEFRNGGGGFQPATYAATYVPDPYLAETHTMTLTGNVTISNPALGGAGANNTGPGIYLVPGQRLTLQLTQDATGGRTVTLGSAYRLNGRQFSTLASVTSAVTFVWDGTNWQAIGGSTGAGLDSATRAWFSSVPPPRPESGAYLVTANSSTGTGGSWTLGDVRFQPVDVAVPTTFTGIGCNVSTLGTGGTSPMMRLAVYADDGTGTRPTGAPLAGTDAALDPTTATGDRLFTYGAPVTLQPGRYWLAWGVFSGTAMTATPTMVVVNAISAIGFISLANFSHRCWVQASPAAATSLPTVGTLTRGGAPPLVGLRAQ